MVKVRRTLHNQQTNKDKGSQNGMIFLVVLLVGSYRVMPEGEYKPTSSILGTIVSLFEILEEPPQP